MSIVSEGTKTRYGARSECAPQSPEPDGPRTIKMSEQRTAREELLRASVRERLRPLPSSAIARELDGWKKSAPP